MIRRFITWLSKSESFMNLSTAAAFLCGVTSLMSLLGFITWALEMGSGFEVKLGVELSMARPGDRVFLLILTVFFGVLSLGVFARDRHIRRAGYSLEGA